MVAIDHLFPKNILLSEKYPLLFFPAINIFQKEKENNSIFEFVTPDFQVTRIL